MCDLDGFPKAWLHIYLTELLQAFMLAVLNVLSSIVLYTVNIVYCDNYV